VPSAECACGRNRKPERGLPTGPAITAGSGDYRFRGSDGLSDGWTIGRRGRSFAGPLPGLSAGLSSLLVGSPPSWMINGSAPSGAFSRAAMAASLAVSYPPRPQKSHPRPALWQAHAFLPYVVAMARKMKKNTNPCRETKRDGKI
jgi:hypothetical protein